MTSSIRRRIEKLEAPDKRLTRRIIWEDGSGSAEREIARLEEAGELDGVELHIVHWQTGEAIAAANELMQAAREQDVTDSIDMARCCAFSRQPE